jgi:uncharacterized protein (DUF302 family)
MCDASGFSKAGAMGAAGLTTLESAFGPEETMNRLEAVVLARGMTIFVRLDYASAAERADVPLRPTELLIFGDPSDTCSLALAAQTVAIDLLVGTLVWQDDAGKTWLSFRDPAGIAGLHGIDASTEATAGDLSANVAAIVQAAVRA